MAIEKAEEIKDFLIYMHLSLMAREELLNAEGYAAIYEFRRRYPQFNDISKENKKIFKWLDGRE